MPRKHPGEIRSAFNWAPIAGSSLGYDRRGKHSVRISAKTKKLRFRLENLLRCKPPKVASPPLSAVPENVVSPLFCFWQFKLVFGDKNWLSMPAFLKQAELGDVPVDLAAVEAAFELKG